MKTINYDKQRLIRQYHTVCSVMGLNDENKKAILAGYGVESSRDLNETQLQAIIEKLSSDANVWRKRVIAAIYAWLAKTNTTGSMDLVKGIACRAAQKDDFNKIPASALRTIYYEFKNKAKIVERIDDTVSAHYDHLMHMN